MELNKNTMAWDLDRERWRRSRSIIIVYLEADKCIILSPNYALMMKNYLMRKMIEAHPANCHNCKLLQWAFSSHYIYVEKNIRHKVK